MLFLFKSRHTCGGTAVIIIGTGTGAGCITKTRVGNEIEESEGSNLFRMGFVGG